MSILELSDVEFAYDGVEILRGVSMEVVAGESIALLGSNGVGKTTLTKLIVRLLRPSHGHIRVVGNNAEPGGLAHHIGYAFQHPDQQLFARTIFDEIAFGPTQLGFSASELQETVNEALGLLDLTVVKNDHPYDLPLATRKLVTIAAAVAQRPQLLILDEPVQGMSRRHVDLVTSVVRGLVDHGTAAIVVTHDLDFAVEVANRAVVLQDGMVGFDGPMSHLVKDDARLYKYGLAPPVAARISTALSLHGDPIRVSDVAMRIAERISRA